jgi:pyridoxamine 5'-phosphate oxidase-like protein
MSMTKAALVDFLRLHRYGVEASHADNGPPEAALVGFVVNERLELFFDSFDSTRKVANLRRDPRIAFVIGGYALGDERTVQYEGEVDVPMGAELERFKSDYFAVHPDGLRRSRLSGITYFRVRPRWIRYTNFNMAPAQVVVFEGAAMGTGDSAAEYTIVMPYTQMKEPWQPQIEREPVFNAFANPQARAGELEKAVPGAPNSPTEK